jgi:hypothetical protein
MAAPTSPRTWVTSERPTVDQAYDPLNLQMMWDDLYAQSAIKKVTANYACNLKDQAVIVDASSGAVTITLPEVGVCPGKHYTIKKIDAINNVTIVPYKNTQLIDGATSQVITIQYIGVDIMSDGTYWWIV